MKPKIKIIISILAATVWISISEFVRNEFLLKSYWTEHYKNLGMNFPSEPLNGAVWGIWSLCFAIAVYVFSTKFDLLKTTILSWFIGFVLMWLVIWNLNVLPAGILLYAIPLSIIESFIAALIVKKLS